MDERDLYITAYDISAARSLRAAIEHDEDRLLLIRVLLVPAAAFALVVFATRQAVLRLNPWGGVFAFPAAWTSFVRAGHSLIDHTQGRRQPTLRELVERVENMLSGRCFHDTVRGAVMLTQILLDGFADEILHLFHIIAPTSNAFSLTLPSVAGGKHAPDRPDHADIPTSRRELKP